MDWHKIAFPEDVFPFSEPHVLEEEVQKIYGKNHSPDGFAVYMEFDDSHSRIYYFNPQACVFCADLFNLAGALPAMIIEPRADPSRR